LRLPTLLLLATTALGVHSTPCSSRIDCELNGACMNGHCECDPGWTGDSCGILDVLPAKFPGVWPVHPHTPPKSGPLGGVPVPISWGASMIEDSGTWHLFVDTCCYNPQTILHDLGGCLISHAVGASPEGPFNFSDIAVPANRFNPHVTKLPSGEFALYNAGSAQDCKLACVGNETSTTTLDQEGTDAPCAGTGIQGVNVALSKSLYGPWTFHDHLNIEGGGDQHNPNPSPLVSSSDGSVLLAITLDDSGAPAYNSSGSRIALATAPNASGPYTHVGTDGEALVSHMAEDPFIFRNPTDGSFHILAHNMENWCWQPPQFTGEVGVHLFSPDGSVGSWHIRPNSNDISAYNSTVLWEDGSNTTFFRRERPELIFDDGGRPLYLMTGVEYPADHPGKPDNHQYSFTVVQPIRRK